MMIIDRISRIKEKIEIELERRGILQPKVVIEIPPELVKQVVASVSYPRKVRVRKSPDDIIREIRRSKWITNWCKSRVLPPELAKLTEEELKTKYPEEYSRFDACRLIMARAIYEKYTPKK